jgi:hypothetical protein
MGRLKYILFLLLFSCEKDDQCWTCKTVSTSFVGTNLLREYAIISNPCGISATEIIKYEEERTNVVLTKEGNLTIRTENACKCYKQ